MKVAVINLSGNTGKTTLSKHLLAPLLKARRVQIEDVNSSDGKPDIEVTAAKFKTLAAQLNVASDNENFVIDIGASNAKSMIEHFSALRSTRAAIDFWIIPVVPASKQKTDSINTAATLMEIGVEPNKIVMLLNNVTDTESVDYDFKTIFDTSKLGVQVVSQVVLANEVFELLKNENNSVFDLANNRPDFKALVKAARDAGDSSALQALGVRMVTQDLAEDAVENLRAVFESTPLSQLVKSTNSASPLKAVKVAA